MVFWLCWRSRRMRADRSAVRLRFRNGMASPRSVAGGGPVGSGVGGTGVVVLQVGKWRRLPGGVR
jgi:hypothetical protein